MTSWNYRTYGTRQDPIRQSDLSDIASSYSCPKRFAYRKEEEASGAIISRKRSWGAACIGTAVHETIAAYLDPHGTASARVVAGEMPSFEAVTSVLERELDKASEGLPIEWKKRSQEAEIKDAAHMVLGA